MSIPIEPASRPRRGFAGAIYLIGGCAMILSAYSMNNLATVFHYCPAKSLGMTTGYVHRGARICHSLS
jgi:hypothetical protein